MAALHADIANAAHLAAEDRLEEFLQAFPFAGSTAPKETRQLAIALKTVI
jgi:hypothetical protein